MCYTCFAKFLLKVCTKVYWSHWGTQHQKPLSISPGCSYEIVISYEKGISEVPWECIVSAKLRRWRKLTKFLCMSQLYSFTLFSTDVGKQNANAKTYKGATLWCQDCTYLTVRSWPSGKTHIYLNWISVWMDESPISQKKLAGHVCMSHFSFITFPSRKFHVHELSAFSARMLRLLAWQLSLGSSAVLCHLLSRFSPLNRH